MAETTTDVRRDIDDTRERMSATIAALESRISGRVESIKETLDVPQLIQDHPLPAVLVALATGFILARSGTDVLIAKATIGAAKRTPGAVAGAAKRGATAVAGLVRRGHDEPDASDGAEAFAATDDTEEGGSPLSGLADRMIEALGVDELLEDMKGHSLRIGRREPAGDAAAVGLAAPATPAPPA